MILADVPAHRHASGLLMKCKESAPARSTRFKRERRMLVTPFSSVVLLCRVHVKTECDRLDSLFMFVSPTLLAAWPLAKSCTTSSTAAHIPTSQKSHVFKELPPTWEEKCANEAGRVQIPTSRRSSVACVDGLLKSSHLVSA